MSNQLPQMPIRAKYADKTAKGVNIDEALNNGAKVFKVNNVSDLDADKLMTIYENDYSLLEIGNYLYVRMYKDEHSMQFFYIEGEELSTKTINCYREETDSTWIVQDVFDYSLVNTDNAGTKLYLHKITVGYSRQWLAISTISTPLVINGNGVAGSANFLAISATSFEEIPLICSFTPLNGTDWEYNASGEYTKFVSEKDHGPGYWHYKLAYKTTTEGNTNYETSTSRIVDTVTPL